MVLQKERENTVRTSALSFLRECLGTAANMNTQTGAWKTVSVTDGYLALRRDTSYDQSNVIGQLYTGDQVEIQGSGCQGSYVFVYSPKYGCNGWVNAGFLR